MRQSQPLKLMKSKEVFCHGLSLLATWPSCEGDRVMPSIEGSLAERDRELDVASQEQTNLSQKQFLGEVGLGNVKLPRVNRGHKNF
mmetsp:Transcript_8713/g.26797  ORF Transcript_8713/g.26797 Transcript_8713/m.26797 type:complete len:86 (+) Transcript_8713:274-531(+)